MTTERARELADHLDMTAYNSGPDSGIAINKVLPVAERLELAEFLRDRATS